MDILLGFLIVIVFSALVYFPVYHFVLGIMNCGANEGKYKNGEED